MNSPAKSIFGSLGEAVSDSRLFHGPASKHVQKLDQILVTAGEPGEMKGVSVFGAQVFTAIIFPVFWTVVLKQLGLVDFLFEGPKQAITYVVLCAAGFFFPMMSIKEKAAARQRSITLQLPDTLDLLTISVEAGLDFMGAMRRVVSKHKPGPLREELERFFKETELGTPRRDGLRKLANRVQLPDMNATVSALIQGDRLGVSIGPILRTQSDMLRTRRSQRAEKAAHEAPVKMLAPLMICILPAVFIMILGPVLIQMFLDATR